MLKLFRIFAPQQRLLQQAREISQLKKEIQVLQARNASMRSGMRRCVTCEYRIDYKNRQDQSATDIT